MGVGRSKVSTLRVSIILREWRYQHTHYVTTACPPAWLNRSVWRDGVLDEQACARGGAAAAGDLRQAHVRQGRALRKRGARTYAGRRRQARRCSAGAVLSSGPAGRCPDSAMERVSSASSTSLQVTCTHIRIRFHPVPHPVVACACAPGLSTLCCLVKICAWVLPGICLAAVRRRRCRRCVQARSPRPVPLYAPRVREAGPQPKDDGAPPPRSCRSALDRAAPFLSPTHPASKPASTPPLGRLSLLLLRRAIPSVLGKRDAHPPSPLVAPARRVQVTLGPKGRNAVLDQPFGAPKITKDGVTVAKAIEFKDRHHNLGAQLVRQVANKTND
eukprot:2234468-Pleurochrysis_carterae.AAC.1